MEDYIIAVITRGRVNDQQFISSLTSEIRRLITIFCHPGEKEDHIANWGKDVDNIVEYGKNCKNLGMARDWIMNYCKNNNIRYIIQIDDNIKIAARTKDGKVDFKYKLLTLANNFDSDTQNRIYVQMFQSLLKRLRIGYGIVGISHRSGNNRKKNAFEENTRLFAIWGINVYKYFKLGVKFSDNPFKEDFHMQLAFLTNGIKTICNNNFTFDKVKGSNADGGCSIYRNLSNVNKGSELLKESYPDFVTIVDKRSDNWSNLSEGEVLRKEVIIHWKKAYESSKKKQS